VSDGAIHTRVEAPVGWLIIDRPDKRNAFTSAMWRDLPVKLKELEAHPDVRVILLRGEGMEAFSAGADIAAFHADVEAGTRPDGVDSVTVEAFLAVEHCAKPTVAVVHGVCFGGGCALALSADIRLASVEARFAITPAKIGLGYPYDGVRRAVEELGAANARYLLLTARAFDAKEAHAMGIVQEVHEGADLDEAATRLGHELAALAPKSIRAIKETVRQAQTAEPDLNLVDHYTRSCFDSADFAEGVRAFTEKRTPNFRGE